MVNSAYVNLSDDESHQALSNIATQDGGTGGYAPLAHNVQPATILSSTINLTKNVLAAGLLSLPFALKCGSIGVGILILVIVCMLSAYSFNVLAKCCLITNTFTYKEIGAKAFGERSAIWIQLVMIGYTLGSCVSFVCLIGDFIPSVMEALGSPGLLYNREFVIAMSSLLFLLPLAFLKNLNPLKFTSMIGVACILYACGLIIQNAFAHGEAAESVKKFEFTPDLFRTVPIFTVSFAAHYNAPKFFEELGADLGKYNKVVAYESIIVLVVYMATGLAGYLDFGADVKGDILNNFSDHYQPALWGRLALAFSIIFTYPFAFHSFRVNVEQFAALVKRQLQLRRQQHSSASLEGSLASASSSAPALVLSPRQEKALIVVLFAFTVLLGIAIPQIEVILAYKGALLGSFVIFIFPGAFLLQLSKASGHNLLADGELEDIQTTPSPHDKVGNGLLDHDMFSPGPGSLNAPSPLASPAHSRSQLSTRIMCYVLIVFGVVTGVAGTIITVLKQSGH